MRGRAGQTIDLTYDNLNRVKTKSVEDPNHGQTNTITYKYDLLGRVYQVIDENNGTTKNTYDKAGRLIRVEYPGSKTVSYQYDAAGNRTRLTYPDGTYITYDYDELNRLTAVCDSSGTAPCLCRGRLWLPTPTTAGPAGRPDPRLREDDIPTPTGPPPATATMRPAGCYMLTIRRETGNISPRARG
jgi:YD repeat-containing protein